MVWVMMFLNILMIAGIVCCFIEYRLNKPTDWVEWTILLTFLVSCTFGYSFTLLELDQLILEYRLNR